jgi:peptidoglycan/LPS O-acetylase OafA/YrhL
MSTSNLLSPAAEVPRAQHRPDIDGLRAVAVSLVVIYHLGIAASGGFVGVDVFFVISGFLITAILRRELSNGTFSVWRFYQRRARRILPALVVMLVAVSLAGAGLLLPGAYAGFGGSLVATALFASNLWFWQHAGYFAASADALPLLHTWSLGVEEQFYLLFPVALLLLHRTMARYTEAALAGATLLSLIASVWWLPHDSSGTFYVLPTRLWELMLGSLLSAPALPVLRRPWLAELAAALGVLLMLAAAFGYDKTTPFPGIAALVPVLGAALVLQAGLQARPLASRLLELKPMVFIGQISYSLYLWHWPVMVLYKQAALGPLLRPQKLGLLVLSLLLATASWRWVEQPFRRGFTGQSARRDCAWAGLVLLILAALGLVIVLAQGFPARLPPRAQQFESFLSAAATDSAQFGLGRCFITNGVAASQYDATACLQTDPQRANVLLMGDSHAAHLRPGLLASFPQVYWLQATASGCRPTWPLRGEKRCTDLLRSVIESPPAGHLDAVMISARWQPSDLDAVLAMAQRLRPLTKRVVVMGPIAEYGLPLPQLLALADLRHDPTLPSRFLDAQPFAVDSLFAHRLAAAGIEYHSALAALCPERQCRTVTADEVPLQFDYGHLTVAGSDWLARQWQATQALRF